jgi:hypothetical protein
VPKSFRLGGEFEREAVPRDSVDDARLRFMKACVSVEPQVLTSLLQDATWAETLAGGFRPRLAIDWRSPAVVTEN